MAREPLHFDDTSIVVPEVSSFIDYTPEWEVVKRTVTADYVAAVYRHKRTLNMYQYELRTFKTVVLTNVANCTFAALAALNGFQKNAAGEVANACVIATGNFDTPNAVYRCSVNIDANGTLTLKNPQAVTGFVNIHFIHK